MYKGDAHELLAAVVERHGAVLAVAHEAILLAYDFANRHLANAPNFPGVFRMRARRGVQNDYAVAWCKSLLQPLYDEGMLDWVEEEETSTIRLVPDLALRIKKTDVEGKASNAKTGRNDRILDGRQGNLFPGAADTLSNLPSELCWFNLAYVPDEFDVGLKFCGLAMADGPILPFDRLDDNALARIAPSAWSGIVAARQRLA